jgi:SprB repeat
LQKTTSHTIYRLAFVVLLSIPDFCFAQSFSTPFPKSLSSVKQTLSSGGSFIENIGQYGKKMKGFENMGAIQYGYEGMEMPILFTSKGFIHLQRKSEKISHAEEERLEKQGVQENEIERKKNVTDRTITAEWVNANSNVEIIAENKTTDYHTYFSSAGKAYGYKKITYLNMYPGIDVIYSFNSNSKPGFEYSLLVKPGADLSAVKLKYGGDVKNIATDEKGNLVIRSDIDGISVTIPVSYYEEKLLNKPLSEINTVFKITDKEISFAFPRGYDKTKAFVIDPFVSGTGNLLGLNAGKARDVDFDYADNIYVTGGGSQSTSFSLAKYNAAGVLQWTFNGAMAIPSWTSNSYYGGWMVEKPTGNIYIGQGFIYPVGFRVVRISTTGLYDNYITTANGNFTEAWKMFWSCNNGSPQILIAGGGINSNINFGVFTPPSTTVASLNVTGIPMGFGGGGWAQDIADFVFDPSNNDMYSIYGSTFGTPSVSNKIYKNTAPYTAASIAWNVPSGYTTVREAANRPYLGASLVDNSANMLWVNASYLYYWDGKNLKAFNKATGAGVGTPLVTANTAFMQGGIIADACNNIFVGDGNGVIKVYNFNGTTFSDAPADIAVPGFAGKGVYDLAYNEAKKLLYASGDGFVASFDVASYCPTTLYTINVVPNCVTKTATATVTPAPPAGSTVTYSLYIGPTLIATNTTGIFAGLNPNITYTIVATINLACSGSQATTTFIIPGPTITTTQINTTCGASTGSITATGSGSTGPYTYSIDGITFQSSGTFSGLAAGVYTVTVRDASGCPNTTVVTILNTNGPELTFTQTNADCGNNTGTVTANATGGTAPYQYSINGGTTYQANNFFTGLVAGQYTLMVKDANNCTNSAIITIITSTAPILSAIPASATCNQNNGTITAFGSGGAAPLEYSINGNAFQAGNIFNGLTPGVYTVTVRDATGCTRAVSVTVGNATAATVTAIATVAACGNTNGTITATGTGGITPYQYSINGGVTYQTSNVFTGLAPGSYTITIKDNTGCTNIVTVTVSSTGGPLVTATTTATACGASTGSITIAGTGGAAPFQYSINGTNFFASNLFNGLAAGNYVVYIRDAAGCIGTTTVAVAASAAPLITAVATPSSCIANDGIIIVTATGGTAPLEYSIDGITYQPGNVFTGLAPGIYTVYVRDANGCIKTTTVTVANASGLTLAVSTISASCSNNGVITAMATGGVAPLTYSINGTVYQASNIFNGLPPGAYTVYVKDANNCIITKQAIVASATQLNLTATVTLQATCASANGVITAAGSGGVAPLQYSINGTVYQTSGLFINVAPGTYTVYVKDATGCIATQTVTVTTSGAGPGVSTFTVRTEAAYPCNDNVGKIDQFRVNGANCATCTYSINFGTYLIGNEPIWSNLVPGTYAITARDANGCTKTILATIGIATLTTATATVTASSCTVNNGTITLTGVGANTPYHASITGIGGPFVTFDPTYTFTGLAPGTYTVIIADDEDYNAPNDPGNCLTTITVIVPSTGGPSVAATQINPSCNSNNGSITATGSGGTAPYTYNINGGAFIASGVFNNLIPGVYIIQVRDNTGCINAVTVTLTGTAVPTLTAVALAASCNTNNGTITATGTGGTAPLEYSLNGTVYQVSNIFTGLAPGTYTVYVKDANNCFSTTTVTITNVPRVQVNAFTIAATCGNSDGSIVATGSAGTTPYTFSIDGIVFQSSGTFTGLAAGFYTVTIKDDRGCANTTGVTVSNAGAPTITTIAASATCGNANGSITVTSTGGTPPLGYSKDGIIFQPSNIFNGLLPGTYIITVRDANGCINTKSVLVANINGPQTLTAVIVHAACGTANGSITATAGGGVAPLQYSINGVTYQAGNIYNGVTAGNYTLYVRDANLCVITLPVTVLNLPGPALTAISSPATCGLNDGTITAIATGGTLPLTYSKDGIIFQTSNIFSGLTVGPYTITVKDARGCLGTANITVATLGAALAPTINCGTSTVSSVIFNWLAVAGATGYTVSYTINAGVPVNIGAIGNLLIYQLTGLNANDNVSITVTPTGVGCFAAATKICTTLACPSITATISYAGPFCTNVTTAQNVTLAGTGIFTGGTYISTPAGLAINAATGAITPSTSTPATYLITYTKLGVAGCANTIATTNVTINPKPVPIIISHN